MFHITKTVTSSIADQDMLSIEAEIVENFGVSPEEVSMTGTINHPWNILFGLSSILRYGYGYNWCR